MQKFNANNRFRFNAGRPEESLLQAVQPLSVPMPMSAGVSVMKTKSILIGLAHGNTFTGRLVMPTPAYRHDHSPEQEKRRITIDGKEYVYPDQLAWPGIATFPGLPSTAIPTGFAPDGRSACRSSGPGWRTRRR